MSKESEIAHLNHINSSCIHWHSLVWVLGLLCNFGQKLFTLTNWIFLPTGIIWTTTPSFKDVLSVFSCKWHCALGYPDFKSKHISYPGASLSCRRNSCLHESLMYACTGMQLKQMRLCRITSMPDFRCLKSTAFENVKGLICWSASLKNVIAQYGIYCGTESAATDLQM